MERSCEKKCAIYHPGMGKAGKLISGIVKITVTAIVIFTFYQQFLK